MLTRVHRDRAGKLRAHYATDQYGRAEIDHMEVVELAHAATGCKPGRRILEPKNSEGGSVWTSRHGLSPTKTSCRGVVVRVH